MLNMSKTRLSFIFGFCIVGMILAMPNMLSQEQYMRLPGWLQQTVNLGLELRGGSQIQLEVDLRTAMKDHLEQMKDEVRNLLRKEKEQIGYKKISILCSDEENGIAVELRNVEDFSRAKKVLQKIDSSCDVKTSNENTIHILIPKDVLEKRHRQIIDQSIEVVRKRIDETGTKEPLIQRQGEDRILVQLPGVSDPADVKKMIGKTAKLTFHLVDNDFGPVQISDSGKPLVSSTSTTLILEDISHKGRIHYVAVKREVKLTGDHLVDAHFSSTPDSGLPGVSIQFNTPGSKKFAEISANNIGRQFAMVLDDKIISAPVFNQAIPSGQAQISGSFTIKEANELALLLRAGSLPAPLKVVEESIVGPSLGADSIQFGKQGVIIAFLLVSAFMLLCYSFFGVIATVALIFNIILLFAGLSLLQATLTLPGIAGIALTIGMAVDANVLIYERIKEELRLGSKVMVAIQSGYNRAMTTIIDSNLTTLLGSAVLYEWGSGPIRGFAVTLALGILISLFTALSLTKAIIYLWFKDKKNIQTLPI